MKLLFVLVHNGSRFMFDIKREHERAWKILGWAIAICGSTSWILLAVIRSKYPDVKIPSFLDTTLFQFAVILALWFGYIALRSLYLSRREARIRKMSPR